MAAPSACVSWDWFGWRLTNYHETRWKELPFFLRRLTKLGMSQMDNDAGVAGTGEGVSITIILGAEFFWESR
jgi:hypothetical protein